MDGYGDQYVHEYWVCAFQDTAPVHVEHVHLLSVSKLFNCLLCFFYNFLISHFNLKRLLVICMYKISTERSGLYRRISSAVFSSIFEVVTDHKSIEIVPGTIMIQS